MRLINSASLCLEEHMQTPPPKYAILSHRWLQDSRQEVSLLDFSKNTAQGKAGYSKIEFCRRQAALDKLQYFWVDTCCIDKLSSAELSEAINSMYRWYKFAEVCYVYLWDVSVDDPRHQSYPTVSTLENSDWFTRGWTVQELIAPARMVFYSKEWKPIGTKASLVDYLAEITGIDSRALEGQDPSVFSISSRMSWAAKRRTTRLEDVAYSLLGIFDVNMPLLYGEGEKAFIRLQEEIMKNSDDQSLFAWKTNNATTEPYRGLLAPSTDCFAESGDIHSLGLWNESESFSMTSKGLKTRLLLTPDEKEKGIYHAALECLKRGVQPTIILQLVSLHDYGNQYVRVRPGTLQFEMGYVRRGGWQTVFVRQDIAQLFQPSRISFLPDFPAGTQLIWIKATPDYAFSEPFPSQCWEPHSHLLGLTQSQTGRLLVSHFAGKYGLTKLSLLLRIVESRLVCRLDDCEILATDTALFHPAQFGPFHECILRRTSKSSKMYATAKCGEVEAHGQRIHTVTLHIKTLL